MKHIWLGNSCLYAPGSKTPYIEDGHPTLHRESLGMYGYINTIKYPTTGLLTIPFTINQCVLASPNKSHFRGPQRADVFLQALASATSCYGNHQDIGWIIQAAATSENLSFDEAFLVHPYVWDHPYPPLFWMLLWSSLIIGKLRMSVR